MFTKEQILIMIKEYEIEKKNVQYVPRYYEYRGKMVECSFSDYVYSDRYHELFEILTSDKCKVFQCRDCGKLVHYFNIAWWGCDFENNDYLCDCCYEDNYGEDF